MKEILTPKQLKANLDNYVIGQDDAKKTLSVAIYNHFLRTYFNIIEKSILENNYNSDNVNNDDKDKFNNAVKAVTEFHDSTFDDVFIEKSNVLLLGGTGTGKTFMIKNIAKILGVPCYIADATKITESGYVGDDVESILSGLYRESGFDVQSTERGIICIDEIDKIAKKGENISITRDVSGEGVQQGLLKIIEGTKIGITVNGGRKHPNQDTIEIDTTNILFICMGAFNGIEGIIERRLNKKLIGFNNNTSKSNDGEKNNPLKFVEPDDLYKFGFIPELVGRLPIITYTNPLTEDDLFSILKDTKNSLIRQYQKLFSFNKINLVFEDEALKEIAHIASAKKTGARGLRGITEKILTDIMFKYSDNYSSKTLKISKDIVLKSL